MNDYWNDPPEELEPPDCSACGEIMNIQEDGSCICVRCGFILQPPEDPMLEELKDMEEIYDAPPPPTQCPHGQPWAECNDCMIAGDQAYDSKRENGK
ncbi:MAG: hypothetical protein M0R32_05805 [Candidatus Cloacimonetes bacterium]|jgi:hypothetical protein|nr:hypothetical protein [Candidatus Cloacimonadota bacterium]